MLTELGYKSPCFVYGKPPEHPEWYNDATEIYKKFWDARKGVNCSIVQYFRWLYLAIWDCDVSLSSTALGTVDDNGKIYSSRTNQITKVGTIQNNRENKKPQYNEDGTISLVSDPTFNSSPTKYGKNPDEWINLQRHNRCAGEAVKVTSFFTIRSTVQNEYIGSRGVDENPITKWPHGKQITSVNITSVVREQIKYFYVSYQITQPASFSLNYTSSGSDAFGTYYETTNGKIFPLITFEGSSYNVNWPGFVTPDSKQPASFPTQSRLSIDGINIPVGTDWAQIGSSGSLNIDVKWKIVTDRNL
jgi:hypothetical protein